MKMRGLLLCLLAMAALSVPPPFAKAQSLHDPDASASAGSSSSSGTTLPQTALPYTRPTEKTKLRNYVFDAFGPYPIVASAVAAGINQARNAPPEWKQGGAGYGRRFASDFGVSAVATTTRFALAKAFHEDVLYYRCECKGVIPRLGHAVISTVTARRGDDGHRVFSFPSLVAPYAGTMTAVYGWYPARYRAMDAWRMGNYTMLGYVGGNIALEFLFTKPHSWLSRMHLNNGHGAPPPGS